ncbi:hypothetical protein T484DRAFT_1772190, partial [Baffinella frigidus]
LSDEVEEEQLRDLFESCGQVKEVRIHHAKEGEKADGEKEEGGMLEGGEDEGGERGRREGGTALQLSGRLVGALPISILRGHVDM